MGFVHSNFPCKSGSRQLGGRDEDGKLTNMDFQARLSCFSSLCSFKVYHRVSWIKVPVQMPFLKEVYVPLVK